MKIKQVKSIISRDVLQAVMPSRLRASDNIKQQVDSFLYAKLNDFMFISSRQSILQSSI